MTIQNENFFKIIRAGINTTFKDGPCISPKEKYELIKSKNAEFGIMLINEFIRTIEIAK